jgi:hypothetical protein
MATQEEIEAATDAAAAQPQQMSGDGINVTNRSIQDLIAWEAHRAAKAAAASAGPPFRMFKTKPPGAV